MKEEIHRGAEAVIYKINNDVLLKDRVRKGYRIKEIDELLRRTRTKKEVSLLRRARYAGVNVPSVFQIKNYSFRMDYIKGKVLKKVIPELKKDELMELFTQVGTLINSMHEYGIVHGDLTTSNMILRNGLVFFIDFSLGDFSNKVEDKAVDLHLIKQALIAKHNKVWKHCFKAVKDNYENKTVLKRLKKVEKRGRKKCKN